MANLGTFRLMITHTFLEGTRNIINGRKMATTTILLTSKASVDATNILFAIFIIGLFVGGMPEVAMLIMAGKLVMRGTK